MPKSKQRTNRKRPPLSNAAAIEQGTKVGIQTGVFVVLSHLKELRTATAEVMAIEGMSEAAAAAHLASLDGGIALVEAMYKEAEQLAGQ